MNKIFIKLLFMCFVEIFVVGCAGFGYFHIAMNVGYSVGLSAFVAICFAGFLGKIIYRFDFKHIQNKKSKQREKN